MTETKNLFANVAAKTALLFLFTCLISCTLKPTVQNTAAEASIHLADPTVFYHGGLYYLYGTVEGKTAEGFEVYTSPDMRTWEGPKGARGGLALKQGDSYGTKGFWAPQVFFADGRFYMAYTANEQIAIAESDSPLGPFTHKALVPLAAPVKQIDPFVFRDEDGKLYLYHVRLQEGNRIFVAEMHPDFSGIKEETLQECIAAEEPWENTANAAWPVAEGPTVLKADGLYYLIYSANDFRNPDYAVGYATSQSPTGPWLKHPKSPFLSKANTGRNGSGHGDIIKDHNGNMLYVFHTHETDSTVAPRKTAFVKLSISKSQHTNVQEIKIDSSSFFYPALQH
ncbi:family 43 glycosylhydrolase [Pontibacter qinzhouensis]|uniref:Family 43 glycosylhydrolase n=1 Tax=Pontibacter qinzhouensis TaxID=2603253 RepID=A0A5C8ILY8_9BACT|nr:glycoside hydrolase family 43 protein [Pontibacter qinzhouensis]TXK21996.1 family 43 glycosylhydrolase [Pontibacter qinzhouensis]